MNNGNSSSVPSTWPASAINQPSIYSQYPQNSYSPVARPPYSTPVLAPARRPVGMMILLVTLSILVIGGALLIGYTNVYVPDQRQAQATATTVARVTGTANANATGTAQMQATQQAQANATAQVVNTLQSKYNQVAQSTPSLSDPLTGPDANN